MNTIATLKALRVIRQNLLYLPIKQYWLDMINSGVKQEEYREIKSYYVSRICPHYKKGHLCFDCPHLPQCRRSIPTTLKFVIFHNYRHASTTYRIKKIHIGFGRQEWGAGLGLHIVITLGQRVTSNRKVYKRKTENHEQTQDNQKN